MLNTILVVLIFLLFLEHVDRYLIVRRLANDGWTLYYMKNCGACHRQMRTIGTLSTYVLPMVESKDAPKKITSFPTWVNTKTGKHIVGVLSRSELRKL